MSDKAIEKNSPSRERVLADAIAARRDSFIEVAEKHYDVNRLIKLGQAALARNHKLALCTQSSVLVCLMRCAELGLEPDAALQQRRMALVPRWNGKLKAYECTYVIDYRAQLQLARDTGLVVSVFAVEVREKDKFSIRYSSDATTLSSFALEPHPFEDRGPVIGYFAAAKLNNGEVQVATISKAETEKHRDRFAPRDEGGHIVGPWKTDFDAQGLKTACRRLWKLLPAGESKASRQLQEAISAEGGDLADAEEDQSALAAPAPKTRVDAVKEKTKAKLEEIRGKETPPQKQLPIEDKIGPETEQQAGPERTPFEEEYGIEPGADAGAEG